MKFTTLTVGFAIIAAVIGYPATDSASSEVLAKRQGATCRDTNIPCTITNGIANCVLCEYEEDVNGTPTVELDWVCLGVQLGILADPCS